MEDSGIQKRTHGQENIATGSRDNSAQGEEEEVSSKLVAVIRDQNDQIPAHNGAGPGSNLIPISTVAGAVPQTMSALQHTLSRGNAFQALPAASHTSAVQQFVTGTSSRGGRNLRSVRAPRPIHRGGRNSQSARAPLPIQRGGRNLRSVRAPSIHSGGRNQQPVRAPFPIHSGGRNQQPVRAPLPIHSDGGNLQPVRAPLPIHSGGRNWQPVWTPYRILSDGRPVYVVPQNRDDGDISVEMSNAVAAEDDVPAGYIKVEVTVRNTCSITSCRCVDYVNFITIVSLEDAPTQISRAPTAYFRCYSPGCDITFGLEEDLNNPFNDSSLFHCPLCISPSRTKFLFKTRFWKRFTLQVCDSDHGLALFHS